jgi:alkylhydroperoxidase family enzyme
MSYLAAPARSDEADTLYDADRASLGYVANYSKVFAHRPQVYRAWMELNGAVKAPWIRRYEVATVAAARELRSSYCSLVHGSELARQVGLETAIKIASDESTDPLHAAIGELARKVAASPAGITEVDLKPLRDLGLSDVDILLSDELR